MSLQTPTTIRSRPNKLYGKAKATPIGRRRGPAVKSVGKPDALIGHVRFDERGRETERLAKPQAAAPSSTLLSLLSLLLFPCSGRIFSLIIFLFRFPLSCLIPREQHGFPRKNSANMQRISVLT